MPEGDALLVVIERVHTVVHRVVFSFLWRFKGGNERMSGCEVVYIGMLGAGE